MDTTRSPVSMCVLVAVLTGAGCNPEIREAERRQQALASEIQSLERDVASLRASLQQAGVRVEPRRTPGKKKGKKRATVDTSGAQSHDLGMSLTRRGALPHTPVARPEPLETACGFRLQLPDLRRISDFQLTQRGLGKASPLRMSVAGTPLAPHAFPKTFTDCVGGFRHAGTVVLFSPPAGSKPADLSLYFEDAFPAERADGRPIYWLHPGQTATLHTRTPWDPSWGEPHLQLITDAEVEPQILVAGEAVDPGALLPGRGPWTVEIRASHHTLLDTIRIGNADHGSTLTSPEQWRAER